MRSSSEESVGINERWVDVITPSLGGAGNAAERVGRVPCSRAWHWQMNSDLNEWFKMPCAVVITL